MKQKKFQLFFWLAMAVFAMAAMLIPKVSAAPLSQVRDYMNRNEQSLTSGVTHEFIITPTTGIGTTPNQLIIVFPDADDGLWCRNGDTLTASTAGTFHDGASALPNSGTALSASCTIGVGASSYDTITISNVGALSTSTYGVKISDATGLLGTPLATSTGVITIKTNNGSTDVDSSNIYVDIITDDSVTVSGTINAALTFAIDDTDIGFGNMDSGTLRYATADGAGSGSTAPQGDPVQLSATTNADDGLVIEIRSVNTGSSAGLYSQETGSTLTAVASTDVSAGSEEFGVFGKNASGMTIDDGFDNDVSGETAIDTTYKTFATTSGPTSSATVDMQPLAGIAATTPAGTYVTTITLVATGRF